MERQTPRVILRKPRPGRFGEEEVLVLEMGLGGAKFEHGGRVDVGRSGPFTCGPLSTEASVMHSVLLPARTGVVYQTGVAFGDLGPNEKALLLELLVHEAKEQVREWEANLSGVPRPVKVGAPARRSAAAPRFVKLRLTGSGWQRTTSHSPTQPEDGIVVIEGMPEEEISLLCETYETSDEAGRELLRRMATQSILEQLEAAAASDAG